MTSAVVVDDSAFMRQLITRTLENGGVAVAGTASDGSEALDVIKQHEPDVVTMDVEMPNVDGLEAVDRIMKERPTPTLMLSAYTDETADVSLEALEKGAVDVFLKPGGEVSTAISSERDKLVSKVRSVAQANVEEFHPGRNSEISPARIELDQPRTLVIGASTGGPRIVKHLLATFPLADCRILIVQHMPGGFTKRFADRLDDVSQYEVGEIQGKERITAGMAAVAPGDAHLVVESYRNGKMMVNIQEQENDESIIPSVDVTMDSVARTVDDPIVGVLLSGMGDDGVAGMRHIGEAGGFRIAQSEAGCAVFGMPRRAIEQGHVDTVLDVSELQEAVFGEGST